MNPKEFNRKTFYTKSKYHQKAQKQALENLIENLGQQGFQQLSDFYDELNKQRFMTPDELAQANEKINDARAQVTNMCRSELKQSKNHLLQDKTYFKYVHHLKMNKEMHEQLNEFLLELQKRKTMDNKELKESKLKYCDLEYQLIRRYHKFREVDLAHQQDYRKIKKNDNDIDDKIKNDINIEIINDNDIDDI